MPQAHGAAQVLHLALLRKQVDHRIGCLRIELGAAGVLQAADIAGKLDHGALHAQADPEEGDSMRPGIVDRLHLATDAPIAKTAGDQDTVRRAQDLPGIAVLQHPCVNPVDLYRCPVGNAAVTDSLVDALVCVPEFDVLADHSHPGLLRGIAADGHQFLPLFEVRFAADQPQAFHGNIGKTLGFEHQGHLVDRIGVHCLDHPVLFNVAEEGDLVLEVFRQGAFTTADDDVRLDPDAAQFLHAVLGRFGLQFPGGPQVGNDGDVNVEHVLPADVALELADRLQEGKRLDVADRAPNLGDHHIRALLHGDPLDQVLDLVGDVRDDLHRVT